MTDAPHHLETLKRLLLPASRRVPIDTAEYQRALVYAIRAIEEREAERLAHEKLVKGFADSDIGRTDAHIKKCHMESIRTELALSLHAEAVDKLAEASNTMADHGKPTDD